MTWTCDQIEARLSDYLEGLLPAAEAAEFEKHARSCAECAPLVESVRRLISEMRAIQPMEAPSGLLYRILEQTLGPQEKVTFWQALRNFGRSLATPKFAYGSASVMATMALLMTVSGFSVRKPKLGDLRPAAMYRNVDRQAHLAYARGVKYVSDLRVVYEIQSRLRQQEELHVTPEERAPKTAPDKKPEQRDDQTHTVPKQQNRADEFTRQTQMLAAQCPVLWGRNY
jgi:anti-sigma factor RsiW